MAAVGSRIRILDFLRGVAILGMLVPNIPWHSGDSMSRVYAADAFSTGAWLMQYLLFDQRFMPIFCMLFGAGVLLLVSRRDEGPGLVAYFHIRMAFLLLIGVGHAYLLWPGDILITYAVCAPLLFTLRGVSARSLIIIGICLKGVDVAFQQWPGLYDATLDRWLFAWWVDYGAAPSTIVEAYAGTYGDLFSYNAWRNQFLQWTALPYFRVWNALAFMLVGMGLFKTGILQATEPTRAMRRMAIVGLAAGGPLVVYGVLARIGANPTVGPYLGFTRELPLANLTFAIGCALSSFVVIAGAQWIHGRFSGVAIEAVERVGRMALTNYIFHSVAFLWVFHFAALLPFDALDHDQMLLLVLAMWAIQLTTSWLWLARFRQGPLEAAWRYAVSGVSARMLRRPPPARAHATAGGAQLTNKRSETQS